MVSIPKVEHRSKDLLLSLRESKRSKRKPRPTDTRSVCRAATISAPGEEWTDIVGLGFGCDGLQYGTLSTTLGTGGATRKLVPSLSLANYKIGWIPYIMRL
jgi:hypothetical protein